MPTRISQGKAQIVASSLVQNKVNKASEMMRKLNTELEMGLMSKIPKSVLDFVQQYPQMIRHVGSVHLSVEGQLSYTFFTFSNLPKIWKEAKEENEVIMSYLKEPERFKHICFVVKKYKEEIKQIENLKRQIICVLTKLSTYKKIEAEYPEAYQELLDLDEKWGVRKSNLKQIEDLCSSVEDIRAKLK